MITHHGWWPYAPGDQVEGSGGYLRHSRIHIVLEGVNNTDDHLVSLVVVTRGLTPLGNYYTEASVVAEGLKDWKDAIAPLQYFSRDEKDVIDLQELGAPTVIPDETRPDLADRMHDDIVAVLARMAEAGAIRRKPEPPAPDQEAYSW